MKIVEIIQKPSLQDGFLFRIVPDSALLRNNEDFYVPNFSKTISVSFGLLLRVKKIGKCIFPQFVSRYFDEYGVSFHFVAEDAGMRLIDAHCSDSISYGFDKSLAVSKIASFDFELFQNSLQFFYNNVSLNCELLSFATIEQAVSKASSYYTLKIGDLFYYVMGYAGISQIGDSFVVKHCGNTILSCDVK